MSKKTTETTETAAKGPRRTGSVTIPQSKFIDDVAKFVKFLTPIFEGEEIKGSSMEPAKLARVAVYEETGVEVRDIVCPALLVSNLIAKYPDAGYVGAAFEVIQHDKREGKKYRDVEIYTVEDFAPEFAPDAHKLAWSGKKIFTDAESLKREEKSK